MSIRGWQVAASALCSLAGAGTDAAATTQMFKCVEGGRTVYQQQACSVSSQPEPASAPRAASKASAAADPASAGALKVKRPSPAASSAPATPR